MDNNGNIFDNSATITPSLEGQGNAVAEGDNQQQTVTPSTEDGQVTEAQQGTSDPEWKAKFKSEEELYEAYKKLDNSYNNLRPQYTKVTQELSTIRKGSRQVDNQSQVDPQQLNPVDALLSKVQAIVAPVKEQNEELIMQTQVARIMQDNADFAELAPSVQEILKAKPYLWNDDSPIETALELARAKKGRGDISKIVTDARAQAYADKEIKIINSAGTKTQPVVQEEISPEQELKNSIPNAAKRGGSIF